MKKNILFMLFGMCLMVIIGVGVYAINANEITYGNTTVDQAIDDLYTKAIHGVKTGEAFLINASKGIQLYHNYNPYGAYLTINNLDFTDIKDFTYSYSLTTSNTSYQEVRLSDGTTNYININSSTSNQKVTINGQSNLYFYMAVANNNTGIFTVSSYTRMDGTVVDL